MTQLSRPDPVTVELVRSALLACANEMKIDLRRSAYNPIINEMNDFSVGIFAHDGDTVAQAPGLPDFLCDIPSAIHSIADDIGGMGAFEQGDIYITNDPYKSTFHLNDVNAIRPIFRDGELVGFTGARAHWHDIGGSSPAGPQSATEIFQEGIIYQSVALYRKGRLNEDVVRILAGNTRLPDTVMGDIRAQVGACVIGESRVQEIIERFGLDVYRGAVAQILDNGEAETRRALEAIPDGVYTAESCVDDDGVERGVPLRVNVTVTKANSRLLIDLTGSAERCIGPMHCNVNTTTSICRLIFKCLTTPTEPANEGHFRMVDVHVPEESIFNAKRPMATKPGFYALHALQDAVKRALADAVPRGVNAEDYGRCCPAHVKSVDGMGKLRILADTEGGGWGAKPFEDGENALLFGDIRVIPIEVIEMRYPVRLRRYALRTDSPGPGKYRGGFGIVKEYECLDDVKLTAGYDRQVCPPKGIAGEAAQPNRIRISRSDGSTIFLPSKQTDYPVKAGETFAFLTAGGGGYGQPVERDLSLIQEDLDEGLFESVEQVERVYHVSITTGPDARRRVDIEASRRLRERAMQRAGSGASTCC